MSDTFNMSGDFRGAIVNIKSTLSDVNQMINRIPTAGAETKNELHQLVKELDRALALVPQEKSNDAEAVAESAKILLQTVTKEQPNQSMVRITAEGLKKAAENISAVAPSVLRTATLIIEAIDKITGG